MMSITALIIQSNGDNIHCEPYGQGKKTKKWSGAINLYHDEFFHTTLLFSDYIFKSSRKAVAYMEGVVKQVRAMNLRKV